MDVDDIEVDPQQEPVAQGRRGNAMNKRSAIPTPHGLRLKRGKNGIFTAPDPGPEAQREAVKRAFPDTNVDPPESNDNTIICDECGWRVEKERTCSNCGKTMSCP